MPAPPPAGTSLSGLCRHPLLDACRMDKLLAALKRNRHGHRDWLVGLIIYRHGLRVSEACDLRWDDIDLPKRTIIARRLKGSTDSVHYLERDEVNGLKLLRRQQQANGTRIDRRNLRNRLRAFLLLFRR